MPFSHPLSFEDFNEEVRIKFQKNGWRTQTAPQEKCQVKMSIPYQVAGLKNHSDSKAHALLKIFAQMPSSRSGGLAVGDLARELDCARRSVGFRGSSPSLPSRRRIPGTGDMTLRINSFKGG
eukprot:Blabericola_migrator_1__13562@NODE_995_length_5755_cov_170_782525_g684_i0_p5_GENE_NODE_995_length_5755_cov_170_782525_g684_i0NODE_995_length_5755_cov_170_782525_g684_i0_p5_ORF_typecomplete_len122_score6_49HTH_IclR/PF09339_10/0_16_NODE_995_length_5755_cov_170_782525_g684_i045394904